MRSRFLYPVALGLVALTGACTVGYDSSDVTDKEGRTQQVQQAFDGEEGGGGEGGEDPNGGVCNNDSDCPDPSNECLTKVCISGTCDTNSVPLGTPIATQVSGNCKRIVCDGSGGTMDDPDPSDLPDDGNSCTVDTCNGGDPAFSPVAAGTACSAGNGVMCNGQGSCVECLSGADCASGVCANNVCQAPACWDTVKNGTETDVDCGGSCPSCFAGLHCAVNGDCTNGMCYGGTCCSPTIEVSDGIDNDCDGIVDEGLRYQVDISQGVVLDTTTSLTWERGVHEGLLFYETASFYCSTLQLAGHDDWRLPTKDELAAIVDEASTDPAINTNAFPNTPSDCFWTSSSCEYGRWLVDFDPGVAIPVSLIVAWVRCVR